MKFLRLILNLFRRRKLDAEMTTEMQAHVDLQTDRNVSAGMEPEEARYAALRQFGNVAGIQEQVREQRGWAWAEQVGQDLLYAIRGMAKAPGFTGVVLLILALGVGVNTTVFSYIQGLLGTGRVPNLVEPDRVVIVANVTPQGIGDNLPYGAYETLAKANTLAGLTAVMQNNTTRQLIGEAAGTGIPVQALAVSGNFFPVLRVPAYLGRTLAPLDDQWDAPRAVVVLSHAFWQRQFGGDPDVVGKTVQLDKVPFQIVGVAPQGFAGADPGRLPVDLWQPIHTVPMVEPGFATQLRPRAGSVFFLIGRLQPGVAPETAAAELDVLYQGWKAAVGYTPEQQAARGKVLLEAGGRGRIDRGRSGKVEMAAILAGVVGLVLLLACANVASLLLARLTARRREFAVRAAIGAGRGRLIRQLLTESLLLVVLGSGLGLLVPAAVNGAIRSLNLGAQLNATPHGTVLLLTLAASACTAVFVGLLPAIQLSRVDWLAMLHASSARAGSRQFLGKALVVLQLAVSVCLLVGTGLFVRTMQNLKNVDLGFTRENLLVTVLGFDRSYDGNRQISLARDSIAALRGLAEGGAVSFSGGSVWTNGRLLRAPLSIDGYAPKSSDDMSVSVILSGPQALATLRVPLLNGRDFTFADAFQAAGPGTVGAAVINEMVAQRFFASMNPIGRQLTVQGRRFAVIGVARSTRSSGLRNDSGLQIYVPFSHLGPQESLAIVLRTNADPATMAPIVAAALARIDAKLPSVRIAPMDDAVDRAVAPERLIANLAGGFGVFALLLASLGLYGLLAYNVAQRTHEIGVRMALGAADGEVRLMIVGQGLRLAVIGGVVGAAVAVFFGFALSRRLYGVSAADPVTLAASAVLLLGVVLFACWLPARRATKVDPVIALRAE